MNMNKHYVPLPRGTEIVEGDEYKAQGRRWVPTALAGRGHRAGEDPYRRPIENTPLAYPAGRFLRDGLAWALAQRTAEAGRYISESAPVQFLFSREEGSAKHMAKVVKIDLVPLACSTPMVQVILVDGRRESSPLWAIRAYLRAERPNATNKTNTNNTNK